MGLMKYVKCGIYHCHLFLICIMIYCLFAVSSETAAESLSEARSFEAIDQISEIVERKYGLRFIYKAEHFSRYRLVKTQFDLAEDGDDEALLSYIRIFSEELYKYPPSFFKKVELTRVGFVKKLFHNDKIAEGLYSDQAGVILFDFSRRLGRNDSAQRHSIHHEIFHMIDNKNLGKEDVLWQGFNTPDWAYDSDWAKKRDAESDVFTSPNPGFVTNYSMAKLDEDKAEVYACLMIPSQHRLIQRWSDSDQGIRKKIQYMKDFIQFFCPEMGEEYWRRLLG